MSIVGYTKAGADGKFGLKSDLDDLTTEVGTISTDVAALTTAVTTKTKPTTMASITDRSMQYQGVLTATGSSLSRTTRTLFQSLFDAVDLRCWWGGFIGDESTPIPNSFTMTASIEIVASPQAASGTLYQLTFNGLSTVTVNPGQIVKSDPFPIDLPKNQYFYIRACGAVADNTKVMPLMRIMNDVLFESNSTSVDDTMNAAKTWTGNNGYTLGPINVEAFPQVRQPTVGIIGSSTGEGQGDIQDTTTPGGGHWPWGWQRRLMAGKAGMVNIAKSGESAYQFVTKTWHDRMQMTLNCEYILEGYGANDSNASRTFAQICADKLRIWTFCFHRGQKVYSWTMQPSGVSSTDAYATLVNQTPSTHAAVLSQVNDWLRDGAPILNGVPVATGSSATGTIRAGNVAHPLMGYLEVADIVESSRNSGKYKVNGTANYATTDGLHMTSTLHIATATALASVNPVV